MNILHIKAQGIRALGYIGRERWFLWLPVVVAAGIGTYFALPYEPSLRWLAVSPVLAGAAWQARRVWPPHVALLVVLCFAAGFNLSQLDTVWSATPMVDYEKGPVQVAGRLMHTEVLPQGVRLTLKDLSIGEWPTERTPVQIRIRMKNKNLADVPPTGSVVRLWANVAPLSEPVMPYAYDFRRQSYFRRMGGIGWSYSAIETVQDAPQASSWRDAFDLFFEHARIDMLRP